MDKVCAFFGHREIWHNIDSALDNAIRRAVLEHGVTEFWEGGYGRFDDMAAHAVVRAKRVLSPIHLIRVYAYLPGKHKLPEYYDGSIYPEGLEIGPQRFAITKRNRWMAQNCDMVICCVDHDYGGAWSACKIASRMGKEVVNLGRLNLSNLQ